MSRSSSVREEALSLDGNRCAICGASSDTAAIEVHHVRPLGVGGSDELDVVENCITLCGECHVMVENGALNVARWERSGELEVIDNSNILGHGIGRVDHGLLWFYRRKEAEEGEQILSELSRFTLLDRTIAERVHRLGQVVKSADPDARSLRECLASHGLLASQLIAAARLYAKSLETHVDWPDGMSVSDYRGLLNDAGLVAKREFFYVMLPARSWLTGAKPEIFYRTAYQQELRDTMNIGERLFQINKFVYGYRAEGGKLYDPEGNSVPFIHFVPGCDKDD